MKRILITGDDGYNSLGTRVLIHYLRRDFTLAIVGTFKQQSGVGGFKSIQSTGSWGKDIVDGIQAYWIDGSPVDAMELAKEVYHDPFDYIISGINWGPNIGGCLLTSGTFSAAVHGVNLSLAKRAIAISWDVPVTVHFRNHSIKDDVSIFFDHPGKAAYSAIYMTLKEKFWGADIVNINLPKQPTVVMEFVQPLKDIYKLWPTMSLNKKTKTYMYNRGDRSSHLGGTDTDVQALSKGHITISPCSSTYLDNNIFSKMIKTKGVRI